MITLKIKLLFLFIALANGYRSWLDVRALDLRECNYLDYPSVVGVFTNDIVCTGSLLTPYWVITAAHCVDLYSIKKGKAFVRTCFGCEQADIQNIRVKKGLRYALYENVTLKTPSEIRYDIGLLRLKKKVKPKKHTHFAILPGHGYTRTCPYGISLSIRADKNNSIKSYTYPNTENRNLTCGDLPIVNAWNCANAWGDAVFDNSTICLVEVREQTTVCEDPYKGPLYCGGVLIGLFANRTSCSKEKSTMIYTKIESYLNFLNSTIDFSAHREKSIGNFVILLMALIFIFLY